MRANIELKYLQKFFNKIESQIDRSFNDIAIYICHVSPRTLRDWRRGKHTIPVPALHQLADAAGIKLPPIKKRLDDFWYTAHAGRIGGLKVLEKYGGRNFGTPEGRKRGAIKALETHRRKKTGFFIPKGITLPELSHNLAEFVGIVLGDGGISSKQITITLHKSDDREYMNYVIDLCEKLFHLKPSLNFRRNSNVGNIIISRNKLVLFLVGMGLCIGSKVRQQVSVPDWINKSELYKKYCIRGLFDTDGCFYVDKHRYKEKVYYNCCMNFTNRSLPLLSFFKQSLEELGFHPTQKAAFNIVLRKEEEIWKYFRTIGSSNPKHYNKFERYFKKKYGGVPKWS